MTANAPVNLLPSTAKIDAFLRTTDAQTPFVVVDVDMVAERYEQLVEAIPGARVYYAVKANPGLPILQRLNELGSAFDVASPAEIDMCLAAGADAANISYGNTIKKTRDIRYAAEHGVRRYTVDCAEELHKVASVVPDGSVCVRLRHDCGGADWPLSRKFGCDPTEVENLLVLASELGLECGVSFHVGSQQRDLDAWSETLEVVASVVRRARARGARPSFLNLGGGFPGTYREEAPGIDAYGEAVRGALATWFPESFGPAATGDAPIELMVEPGRYMVADAGVLRTEVVLVSRRSPLDT